MELDILLLIQQLNKVSLTLRLAQPVPKPKPSLKNGKMNIIALKQTRNLIYWPLKVLTVNMVPTFSRPRKQPSQLVQPVVLDTHFQRKVPLMRWLPAFQLITRIIRFTSLKVRLNDVTHRVSVAKSGHFTTLRMEVFKIPYFF